MVEYPNQRVSRSAKEVDNFYKPTYDFLISKALNLNPKDNIKVWLEAANGIISNESINYLVSPLMDTETKKTIGKLPGEIRDTDLINIIRERNIGEYIGLPYKFTVDVFNPDVILRRDAKLKEEVDILMQQSLVTMLNDYYNGLQQQGKTPEQTKKEDLPDIEKYVSDFLQEYVDERAIKGKNILNLINAINDFDTKRIQSFYYWWATEEFYTYREIVNNEVYTSVLSPLEGYPIFNDQQFVEDYDGFIIKKRTTLTQVKAQYWEQFSPTEQKYLEALVRNTSGSFVAKGEVLAHRIWDTEKLSTYRSQPSIEFDITDSSAALDEYTIIWRTEVPVKIKTFLDVYGNEREEAVPDDYEMIEGLDVDIREEWIEEVYIGKRFGNAVEGVYLKPSPCDVQRYDRHTMQPKLPVGGKKGILRNVRQNPIPNRLISFVIIDRLILLIQERTLAKYEGYIKIIPQSMLNNDSTGSTNEKLFFIKADNTLVYDDTAIDFNTVAQGFRVINMPEIANFLKTLIDLRANNKAEALEIANMNQYRLGDVMASTGKGVMEESIYRAALGNVLAITMFHAALEKDHIADLEFSKIAYPENKQSSYTDKTTGKPVYVNVNIEEHRETDYGVVVENSKVDKEKIDMFRKIAFNASQNGDIDSAVAAVELDSVPELRQALKKLSKTAREFEEKMAENQNATQKYVADAQTARQDSINETTKYVADKQAETAITIAEMKSEDTMNAMTEPVVEPIVEDKSAIRREELEYKRNDANAKNALNERKLNITERLNRDKLKLQHNKKSNK